MRDVDARFEEITHPDHGYAHQFRWRRSRLVVYRAAERRRLSFSLNRYPGVVIGAAVQLGRKVFSLAWGKPGGLKPGSCIDCAKGVRHIEFRAAQSRRASVSSDAGTDG